MTFPGSLDDRAEVGAEPTRTVSGVLVVPLEELRSASGSTLPALFD